MSVADYAHSVDLSGSTRLIARMPVDLSVPSAFYSLPLSSGDNLSTPSPSPRTGLPHGIPQPSLSLIQSSSAAQTRLSAPPYGQEFFFHNKDFLRYHSTSPTSPASPCQPQPSSSTPTHPFSLNSSFPPTYSHRHFHEVNFPPVGSRSPASSNPTSTPEHDLHQTATPDALLSPKTPTDSSPDLLTSSNKERFDRFPPAKRFIRSLASSPSEETPSASEKRLSDKREVKSVRSDDGEENIIDEENKIEAHHEVDFSFPLKSTVPTSHQSHYLSQFSSTLPSSTPGAFHSSLFPVSFATSQLLKPHPVTPSPFLKRRHSANNPIVVDSNIPFTTYLHNLTLTLQQSAARAKSMSSYSDLVCKEELESHGQESEAPDTTSETRTEDAHNGRKRRRDNSEESSANINILKIEEGSNDQDICSKSDDEEMRVQSSEERYVNESKVKRKRKLYLSGKYVPELHGLEMRSRLNNVKSGRERSPIEHPSTAPILSSMAFPVSPESHVISSSHLHSPHLLSQHQQLKQPPSLNPQPTMQALPLSSMRSPRSPRVQHAHLSSAAQFPSLYSKLFPPFASSPNQSHLNFTNSITGPAQTLGGLSTPPSRLNSLFHPSFLSLGNMSMRRTSADKPPPVKKYKCDVCQKAFSRSNTLVTHKRIHTGDKPFKCEICGRAFRQPGNLTRHRLTHTTHKPYVCHVCNKAFNRASNLNTHIRTHSSFRHFGCSGCPKNFHFKPDMANHIYSPNGERPFKCDICGRGFAHSSTLATHQRTHNSTDTSSKASVDGLTSVFV